MQAGLAVAEQLGGVRRPWTVENESGRIHVGPAPRRLGSGAMDACNPRFMWVRWRIAGCGRAAHRLRYRVFSLLSISTSCRCSRSKPALLFARPVQSLRLFAEGPSLRRRATICAARSKPFCEAPGMEPDGGAIRLLTMPRILGYGFNPLSIFFCYRADGALARHPLRGQQHFRAASLLSLSRSTRSARRSCPRLLQGILRLALSWRWI